MVLGGDNSQPVHSAKTGVAPIAVVITKMVSNFLVDVSVCLCMEWQPVWQWLSFWKPKLQEAGISLFARLLDRKAVSSCWRLSSHSTTHLYSGCLMSHPYNVLKNFSFLPLNGICKSGCMLWAGATLCRVAGYVRNHACPSTDSGVENSLVVP